MSPYDFVDCCLVFSAPVQLTLRAKSHYLEHDGPGPQRIVGTKIQSLIGERVITARDYWFDQGQALLKSTIFDEPVRLALAANRAEGRERGLLKISLAAAPTAIRQEAEILDIDHTLPDGLGLWDLPEDRIGIQLGDRWFSAGPDVLAKVPVGPDLKERFAEFEAACRPFFNRILFGDPTEEAERLIRSVASEVQPECRKCGQTVDRVNESQGWCAACAWGAHMRRIKGTGGSRVSKEKPGVAKEPLASRKRAARSGRTKASSGTRLVLQKWTRREGVFVLQADWKRLRLIDHVILTASTWGEFEDGLPPGEFDSLAQWQANGGEHLYRRNGEIRFVPQGYPEAAEEEEWIIDAADPFDPADLFGFCDGDYPPWMSNLVEDFPAEFLEEFGSYVNSFISGSWYQFPLDRAGDMAEALREVGYELVLVHDSP